MFGRSDRSPIVTRATQAHRDERVQVEQKARERAQRFQRKQRKKVERKHRKQERRALRFARRALGEKAVVIGRYKGHKGIVSLVLEVPGLPFALWYFRTNRSGDYFHAYCLGCRKVLTQRGKLTLIRSLADLGRVIEHNLHSCSSRGEEVPSQSATPAPASW